MFQNTSIDLDQYRRRYETLTILVYTQCLLYVIDWLLQIQRNINFYFFGGNSIITRYSLHTKQNIHDSFSQKRMNQWNKSDFYFQLNSKFHLLVRNPFEMSPFTYTQHHIVDVMYIIIIIIALSLFSMNKRFEIRYVVYRYVYTSVSK